MKLHSYRLIVVHIGKPRPDLAI